MKALRSPVFSVAVLGAVLCPMVTRLRGDDVPKDRGPFVVVAHGFRGPGAEIHAKALALELRTEHHLPAYVRGMAARLNQPAGEEVAVLVGDYKSIDQAEAILKRLKRIAPRSLDGVPKAPKTLKGSYCTANPIR